VRLATRFWVHQLAMHENQELSQLCTRAVEHVVDLFAAENVQRNELAITLIRLRDEKSDFGHVNGDQLMHPASVVKLFFLVYALNVWSPQKLAENPELSRALTNMIVDSDNDATSYVLDHLTGTTSGPELAPTDLKKFVERRQVVNQWFESRGYQGLNASNKTWTFEPYGRDRQALGPKLDRRNRFSTNLAARLMFEVMTDTAASQTHCEWMRSILSRPVLADSDQTDRPANGRIAAAVPSGCRVWSKSGWTSFALHDVGCIELPGGDLIVLAVFTLNHSANRAILLEIVRYVIQNL